ncbi:RNA polymerase sigma factor [Hamadaea tsunoensis]|uniref:RNA polymerase sigma factor n=1 Tax=Hamadaea tsunoensis TaxID=53368 RepID=UPI001B7FA393|nr:sigma-70 family RNA polymerase sigma factor [Hamadaea tsunoensis]
MADAVAAAHRAEWARVLAATVRVTKDLDLAEECTQDAFAKALESWPRDGVPDRPGAWLTTVARNRAVSGLRHESALQRRLPLLVTEESTPGPEEAPERPAVDDDRLRLIFTCCHPTLSREAQVALTLRLLCGLSTGEVARAFLVSEATMAARVTRAKKKIAAARVPYRIPTRADLPARVSAVLQVVHLLFTTGHTAPIGDRLVRGDLVESAIGLARMLYELLPGDAEVAGLLALLLLIDARRATRQAPDGRLLLLREQDRARWDRARIDEGVRLLTVALSRRPSRYAVEAAIAAVHAEAPTWAATDWTEIVGLYDVLRSLWDSPVVELNRAVAVGERDGAAAGLAALDALLDEPVLAAYGYLSAARAEFLGRLGRWPEAVPAYEEALALTDNDVERAFLDGRLTAARLRL